jgi:hypothetical protein
MQVQIFLPAVKLHCLLDPSALYMERNALQPAAPCPSYCAGPAIGRRWEGRYSGIGDVEVLRLMHCVWQRGKCVTCKWMRTRYWRLPLPQQLLKLAG